LLELIESTLEIGKLEAGRGGARVEPIVLTAFWRDLGAGCCRFPRRPGVVLDWQDDAPALAIQTDPHKLSIVVRNLVGNALKFTERGHVRAEVAIESTDLTIRITDTGIGIGPEDRETIFEMFRQVDGSDKRSYGGVGLGLYLVRRFVEQLGGTVSFESEMGRGTTFVVRLPHAVVPAQHSANAA
jgi:signal transduction histidine kinase